MSMKSRLDEKFKDAVIIPFHPRIAGYADLHRGVKNLNDNFMVNYPFFEAGLAYYKSHRFKIMEIGDGFERWENRHFSEILDAYPENPADHRLKGNHDWELWSPEAFKMQLPDGRWAFFTHGNVDWINGPGWKLGRFLVRYFWVYAERIGVKDFTSASKSQRRHEFVEKALIDWTRENDIVALGAFGHIHTERLEFVSEEDLALAEIRRYYVNAGCGVKNGGITNFEFEYPAIRLVKWETGTDGFDLKIRRIVLKEGRL